MQSIHDEAYDLVWEFFRYPSEYGNEKSSKIIRAEKKLLSVVNHTIDAIRYNYDSLIEKLSAERAEYKKLFEEAKHYSKNSDVSSEIASDLIKYGLAFVGMKILYK